MDSVVQQSLTMDAPEAERAARLRQIQMEALGTLRRDFLTTHDAPDRSSPIFNPEHHRRINQRGTQESAVTDRHRTSLAGWNSLEEGLEDLNAGQTHRARLLTAVPEIPSEPYHQGRGSLHRRGTGRGGRGGGAVGSKPTRTARRSSRTSPGQLSQLSASSLGIQASKKIPVPDTSSQTMHKVKPARATQALTKISLPEAVGGKDGRAIPRIPPQSDAPTISRVSQKPPTTTLFDSPGTGAGISTVSQSYAGDLLDIDITGPGNLPEPIQLSATANRIHPESAQPTGQIRDLDLLYSEWTRLLPMLKQFLSAEAVGKLESISVELQQQVVRSRGGVNRRSEPAVQQPKLSGPEAALKADNEVNIPIRGLADAVQQRTLAWTRDVIAGTGSSSNSILGENITRGRFSRRLRVSVDSLTSLASVSSSTALRKRIDELQIDEARPTIASADGRERYATTNPFGVATTSSPIVRAQGYQLPHFLRSEARAQDPAAALRAEYTANSSRQLEKPTGKPTIQPASAGSIIRQATAEASMSPINKPLQDLSPSISGVTENTPYRPDIDSTAPERISRKDSSSSAGVSRKSPALNEDLTRLPPAREFPGSERWTLRLEDDIVRAQNDPRHTQSAAPPSRHGRQEFVPGPSNPSRSGPEPVDDLPRFHPRLGNRIVPLTADATHLQAHSYASNSAPAVKRSQRPLAPALPGFLANIQPSQDPGSAAAEQYGGAPVSPQRGQKRPSDKIESHQP
ncbi:MAG: hypothetical protein Q9200_000645 [Gallowayella weberi]